MGEAGERVWVVLDLEWNNARQPGKEEIFNEIIEIGGVMLDASLRELGVFQEVVRPVVQTKLKGIIRGLTRISDRELAGGIPFAEAIERLTAWIGGREAAVLTWSRMDLLVMMENFRHFFGGSEVPFIRRYADIQPFCQQRLGVGLERQMALEAACAAAGVDVSMLAAHRAADDARATAALFTRLYDAGELAAHVRETDRAFYERMAFKARFVTEADSPLIPPGSWAFDCGACGEALRPAEAFRHFGSAFFARMRCPACGRQFQARVQARQMYDGVQIKRRLREHKQEETEARDDG